MALVKRNSIEAHPALYCSPKMPPTALFDKSFLQSLSVAESAVFDNFFYTLISPIFYVETLADLEKAARQGKTPEDEVGIIAEKVPEMNVAPNIFHRELAIRSLLGATVPMDGRMLIAGKTVKQDGHLAVIHEPTPEAEAFERWQQRDFLDVERRFARRWRAALNNIDLLAVASGVRALGIMPQTCKSLQAAKDIADSVVGGKNAPDLIKFATMILNFNAEVEGRCVARWENSSHGSFREFAPYAAYVISVEIFFQIALGAGHIATARPSNRTDIAYLFYLPFCRVFISSDRLHERCAPLFLRDDQRFVWGQDLKADLQRLVQRYKAYPAAELEKGLPVFAPTPPRDDDECLTGRLWDLSGPKWREEKRVSPELMKALEPALRELTERFNHAPEVDRREIAGDLSNVGMVEMSRQIRRQKGSFWQGPKDAAEDD